jgi:putative transcriptional regulator
MSIIEQAETSLAEFKKLKSGKQSKAKKVTIKIKEIPEYNEEKVLSLRRELEMTQTSFAFVLGVSPRTVESWEQGRTKPKKNSERLMSIIEEHPEIIDEIITVE